MLTHARFCQVALVAYITASGASSFAQSSTTPVQLDAFHSRFELTLTQHGVVGGGFALVRTPSAYAKDSPAQSAATPTIWLDARYALSNHFEVLGSAFYETGNNLTTSNATVPSDTGTFEGTLQFHARRFGALVGGRVVRGNVWRFVLGGELGLSLASYSSGRLLNSSGQDIGLKLADMVSASLIVAPSAGVVWAGDRVSVSLVPRAELLLGSNTSWALVVPLTIGWDFYGN